MTTSNVCDQCGDVFDTYEDLFLHKSAHLVHQAQRASAEATSRMNSNLVFIAVQLVAAQYNLPMGEAVKKWRELYAVMCNEINNNPVGEVPDKREAPHGNVSGKD